MPTLIFVFVLRVRQFVMRDIIFTLIRIHVNHKILTRTINHSREPSTIHANNKTFTRTINHSREQQIFTRTAKHSREPYNIHANHQPFTRTTNHSREPSIIHHLALRSGTAQMIIILRHAKNQVSSLTCIFVNHQNTMFCVLCHVDVDAM